MYRKIAILKITKCLKITKKKKKKPTKKQRQPK